MPASFSAVLNDGALDQARDGSKFSAGPVAPIANEMERKEMQVMRKVSVGRKLCEAAINNTIDASAVGVNGKHYFRPRQDPVALLREFARMLVR
ncbi:hypothetical protein [Paraburkholderia sp. SARCC-3016]|uniref:hypothetical protein n=1 Tax=Paraburkholderia sp. SARCC-3016 TaxID=3058611 RepID=UPI00280B8CDC|nr:hypothetical protein [Paraburkholderia sp. SARCC-3016]